jgi:carboxymethylenebutenolidase
VIHENRGLNPYIEDVARRLAAEGYLAFAPDALAPVGGYPGDEDKAREMFAKLDGAKRTEDLMAAVDFVKQRPEFGGKFGAIGFCFGGGMVNLMPRRSSRGSALWSSSGRTWGSAQKKASSSASVSSGDCSAG